MQLGLTRRNIGRLVLLVWAVALAWLARREFAPTRSATLAERTGRLEPAAQYFAVMAGARQIGQLNRAVDTMVNGVRLTELLVIDVPDGDSTRQLARSTEVELSRTLRLRRFTRTVFGAGIPERLEGGLGPDSLLTLQNAEAEMPAGDAVRLRIHPEAVLPTMIPYRAALGDHLRIGERFELPLLELGTGQVRPLAIRVTAESTFVVADSARWDSAGAQWVPATWDTVRAWRLEHDAGGSTTESWVDGGGGLMAEEIRGGHGLARSAFEIVGNNYRRGRRVEGSGWRRSIPGMVSLAATGQVPDTTAAVRRFLLSVEGPSQPRSFPVGILEGEEGARQAARGDTLLVRRRTAPRGAEAGRPREWLAPGWDLAGLNDSAIRQAAAQAVGRAATLADSAANLTRWVATQIATDRSPGGVGTAPSTLRNRRGTPDGKARLLASVARASGIPARVVSGVAVLPQGHFGHAWVELWAGRWIAADPTFGHFPASASLIRIRLGERSRPPDLVPLIASARFLPIGPGR